LSECCAFTPEPFRASADSITRHGTDGTVLTLEGRARLRWQRQGRRAEVTAADRIVVDLLSGSVEASLLEWRVDTQGQLGAVIGALVGGIPSQVVDARTPVPEQAWVTAPRDAQLDNRGDDNTPILPPVTPGAPLTCGNPPDQATILRALPRG